MDHTLDFSQCVAVVHIGRKNILGCNKFSIQISYKVLFSVFLQQDWNCWLCTTTRRSGRARWNTTLSKCLCGFKAMKKASKVWRPTGWITWPNTSTMVPRWLTDISTWATGKVSILILRTNNPILSLYFWKQSRSLSRPPAMAHTIAGFLLFVDHVALFPFTEVPVKMSTPILISHQSP